MAQRSTVAPAAGAASAALLCAVLLHGCGHTEPFTPAEHGTDQPFNPTPPVQLTFNGAADRAPAWLADGSGIVYSTQLLSRPDHDLCLALLPPAGGRQRELWCDVPGNPNATDAIESPTPGPDGQLAFVAATTVAGGVNPITEAVALAPTLDPPNAAMVRTLPYTPQGGTEQNAAGQFRWLDPGRLVFLGQRVVYRTFCFGCPLDTLVTGLSVNLLEVNQPGSLPTALPGTGLASGVTPAPGGDAVFFTVSGDSRVFHHTLSTGQVDVAYDFGGEGIARDLHAVGNRLVAVVGGRVAFTTDPLLGPVQWDSGGVLHVVDLDSDTDVPLVDPEQRLYRRPALSPTGDRIAAEGHRLIIELIGGVSDTTVDRAGDIFLFGAP
jgi:hypothetical protein